MTTAPDEDYDWRHGWIPLTMRAAMQKAHGNVDQAEELLEERRRRRRGRRQEFVTPHPRHQAEHAERQRWAGLSDDDLAEQLGAAEDDETLDRIAAELDRRDRAERKAERERERRRARRTAEDERRAREFDAATDAGDDPEEAYARIYGVSEERQRRDAAAAELRASGWAGKTFREMVKTAHTEHVRQAYLQAEDECRGHVLNAAGQRAGIDPESLFSGSVSRAKKYASEELMIWFRNNGRLTVADFTAGLLGGEAKFHTTGDAW